LLVTALSALVSDTPTGVPLDEALINQSSHLLVHALELCQGTLKIIAVDRFTGQF
jgi:hypothetical protein